jgi:hypothetical protein
MTQDGVDFILLLIGGRQEAGKQKRGRILKTKPRSVFTNYNSGLNIEEHLPF